MINLGTYLKQYKVGDIVDVVANGAVQKGMVCDTRSQPVWRKGKARTTAANTFLKALQGLPR